MHSETPAALALEAAFDGGRLTSDGGTCWLAKADAQLGLCETIADHVPEWRRRKGRHSPVLLVRQRVFQIACGYEDQNDSNSLRSDPLLKSGEGKPRTASNSKRAMKADRLGCHQFLATQFRLLLHAAAYWLSDVLRSKLVKAGVERMQLDTLRLILIKVDGRVR